MGRHCQGRVGKREESKLDCDAEGPQGQAGQLRASRVSTLRSQGERCVSLKQQHRDVMIRNENIIYKFGYHIQTGPLNRDAIFLTEIALKLNQVY